MIKVYKEINGDEAMIYCLPSKGSIMKTAIMGINEVQISVTLDAVIDARVGDYIKIGSTNYTLNREPEYEKRSDVEHSYDFTFEHPVYTLLDKLYEHNITRQTAFTLTGKLVDFLALLLWNINKNENALGVDLGWTTGLIYDTGYKTLHFEHLNCREVLNMLSDKFECEYFCDNKELNFINRIENATSFVFEQGQGKGLYKIEQKHVDKEDTVTRIRPRGGNKNVPNNKADSEGYLKLPEHYIESFSEHSKVVERQVTFDDVFPHFEGVASGVSGENNSVFLCPQINFDLNAIAVGENARVNFLTGALIGMSFKFDYNHTDKKITLIKQDDETALPDADGKRPQIPSALRKVSNGDTFNFTGVLMPQTYNDTAITKLRQKATKWLNFHSQKRVKFELDVDYRWLRGKAELNVGDLVVISIPERSFSKLIRVVSLEKNMDSGAIRATVSNYLEENWTKYFKSRIENLRNEILTKSSNIRNTLEGIFKDGIVTETELKTIQSSITSFKTERGQLNAQYVVVLSNNKLINKAPLEAAWDDYQIAYNNIITSIEKAVLDKIITEQEKEDIDVRIAEYLDEIGVFSAALEHARDVINGKIADDVIDKIPVSWELKPIPDKPSSAFLYDKNGVLNDLTFTIKFLRSGVDVTSIMQKSTLRLYEFVRINQFGIDDKGVTDVSWNQAHLGATSVTLTHEDIFARGKIGARFDDELLEQEYQKLK